MKGSGIAQLLSVDYKDSVLTKKPQVTFFRDPQKQHTPFALDTIDEPFNEIPDFGSEVFCKLSNVGDLVDSLTLSFTLSSVHISNAIDSALLSNYLSTPITFNEYTLTAQEMVNQYESLIEKFKLFMSSSMVYWRGFRSLLTNSSTNYTTIVNLASTYQSNQDDTQEIYESNNEFSSARIGKTYIYFNFDILTHIITQYTSDASSIYNTTLTQLYKAKIKRYLDDYIEYQKIVLQSMIDNKAKFTKILSIASSSYYSFAWTNNIGLALIDELCLEIGGRNFDLLNKHTLQWYYIHNVLVEHQETVNELLGNTPILTSFDQKKKPQTTVYVNIPFGHIVYNSMTIPVTAMKFQDTIIRLKVSSLDECCLFEPDFFSLNTHVNLEEHVSIVNASMSVNYVHLSNKEREKFSMGTIEMLIEQSKFLTYNNVSRKASMFNLDFSSSIKDIQWTIQSNYNVDILKLWNEYDYQYRCLAKTSSICHEAPNAGKIIVQLSVFEDSTVIDPTVFTGGQCIITNSKFYNGKYKILSCSAKSIIIDFNQFIYPDLFSIQLIPHNTQLVDSVEEEYIVIYGETLDTPRDSGYFKHVKSLERKHSSKIHKRSISLHVDELQPSGVLNFGKIKNKHLRIKFSDQLMNYLEANGDSITVKILGRNYNFSVIEGGYNKLVFGY